MVRIDDMAPTSLSEGRGSRWLDGSRRGGVTWRDLRSTTWSKPNTRVCSHDPWTFSDFSFIICHLQCMIVLETISPHISRQESRKKVKVLFKCESLSDRTPSFNHGAHVVFTAPQTLRTGELPTSIQNFLPPFYSSEPRHRCGRRSLHCHG